MLFVFSVTMLDSSPALLSNTVCVFSEYVGQ